MRLSLDVFVFEPELSYTRAVFTVAVSPMLPLLFTFNLFSNRLMNSFAVYTLMFILFWFLMSDPRAIFKRITPWGETVGVGFTLFGAHSLIKVIFLLLVFFLFGADGVKNSSRHMIGSVNESLLCDLLNMVWVSISEEMGKVTVFLALVRLFSEQRFSHIFFCACGASLIFGWWHGLSFTLITTSIALSSIPDFLMFAYYRSVIPLVIAHFLTNAAVVLSKAGFKPAVGFMYLGSLLAFVYIIWLEERRFQREVLSSTPTQG